MRGIKKLETEMETGGLCEDLIGEILDHLPINQVTRMKCLSNHWHSLVSRYRRSRPRTSSSMFLCQQLGYSLKDPTQVILLNPREQQGGRGVTMHKAFDFSIDGNIIFMGSSSGLLLFHQYTYKSRLIAHVCNPAHKQWQWDTLPRLPLKNSFIRATELRMGLAFDGVPSHPYKVIFYAGLNHDGCLEFQIYSSDTRQWREYVQRVPLLILQWGYCELPELRFLSPHLFLKGNIICKVLANDLYKERILVHNIQSNLSKLMRLPKKDGCFPNMGFLWSCEGILHCCRCFSHGFHVWKYMDDINEGLDEEDDSYFDRWKLKHTADIINLATQHPDVYGPIEDFEDFDPCAFDEDLQIIYIQLPTTILSYSFETGRLEKIWTFEQLDKRRAYPCFRTSLSIEFNRAYYPVGDSILSIPEAYKTT